ncbi:hypothetical protein OROGR_014778 [Orobanche gracilis]
MIIVKIYGPRIVESSIPSHSSSSSAFYPGVEEIVVACAGVCDDQAHLLYAYLLLLRTSIRIISVSFPSQNIIVKIYGPRIVESSISSHSSSSSAFYPGVEEIVVACAGVCDDQAHLLYAYLLLLRTSIRIIS